MDHKKMTIEEMCFESEKQLFDPKSARISATALVSTIIAFANADGGKIAIGIEDDGMISGIDNHMNNINDILRAPLDYCYPSIMIDTEILPCIDHNGKNNHILVINVPQSSNLHTNHRDEVFLRVGDKSKKTYI